MPDDILKEAQDAYREACDAERDDRADALDDIKFARLGEQWDPEVKDRRTRQGRPTLTINKLPPFIRQLVNDARQNKPQIKVLPQDSSADPETAEILSGLIRNIESSSDADVAYDTALDCAASSGWGYFRINTAYASDDTFEQDIVYERIANPLTVYRDPYSEAADSSDWNVAFVTQMMPIKVFNRRFAGAARADFSADQYPSGWRDGEQIMLAEYWKREQVKRKIVLLTNGQVVGLDEFEANIDAFAAEGITVEGSPRDVPSHKVTQRLLTGVEEIDKVEWAGRYIPIIPVYGDEVNIDGKRRFRSLIRDAKDAQVMFNAWRTLSTELVALAPKAPFIGAKGQFKSDTKKWGSANVDSHAFIEYDPVSGAPPPQRQPFAGVPAGALQEALNASDDMKAIIGVYDASLGARSNETSGKAIMARQREGDVSTFHFIDNLSRAVRHGGRILLDLIPHVYSTERVIRTLGQDNTPTNVRINTAEPVPQPSKNGEVLRIYDLSAGKYDLTVSTGPSFTTRREEAATQMTELIRAYPDAAPVLGDLLAKNLDWPGADEIATRLKALLPPALQGQGANPEVEAVKQQAQQIIGGLQQQLEQVNAQEQALKARELDIKEIEANTKAVEAKAKLLEAQHRMTQPTELPRQPSQAAA